MWSRKAATYPLVAVLVVACTMETPDDPAGSGGTIAAGGTAAGTGGSLSTSGGRSGTGGGTATSTGGASLGGASSGGTATGGVGTGGRATGGASLGGASTGGRASGGTATGGRATGGTSTGGKATGGMGTGGATASNCTCVSSAPPACTATGHVTYTLARSSSPTAQEQSAYDAISCAMDMATAYYNCYTSITKSLNVSYVPSVATADGNINGSIRFGSTGSMNCITAMHEIGHTVGIGTSGNWSSQVSGGIFTGANATAEVRSISGNQSDVLHADTQHFWPHGLNYTTEASSPTDLVNHCRMVVAIRRDLGM